MLLKGFPAQHLFPSALQYPSFYSDSHLLSRNPCASRLTSLPAPGIGPIGLSGFLSPIIDCFRNPGLSGFARDVSLDTGMVSQRDWSH